MKSLSKQRITYWALAIVISLVLVQLDSCFGKKEERDVIYVCAPESMIEAFNETLEITELYKKYELKSTDNYQLANFFVTGGLDSTYNIIAYSPIVAVFNEDEELYNSYINEGIFIQSEVATEEYDFDFKKVIDNILDSDSNIKVYCPKKSSDIWDEFYSFLLFTVNDGYYPKEGTTMEVVEKKVENFLNSKNVEEINYSGIGRNNGFAKNSIYFMPYADLLDLYKTTSNPSFSCRVMYPKTVVYHNYYAVYDEEGKILYDTLESKLEETLLRYAVEHIGYNQLYAYGYNTKYNSNLPYVEGPIKGKRDVYNGVEIPK